LNHSTLASKTDPHSDAESKIEEKKPVVAEKPKEQPLPAFGGAGSQDPFSGGLPH